MKNIVVVNEHILYIFVTFRIYNAYSIDAIINYQITFYFYIMSASENTIKLHQINDNGKLIFCVDYNDYNELVEKYNDLLEKYNRMKMN